MDKDEVEVLKLLAGIADKESDHIWTRYQIMFFASIGLLAILAWELQNPNRFAKLAYCRFLGFCRILYGVSDHFRSEPSQAIERERFPRRQRRTKLFQRPLAQYFRAPTPKSY